MNRAIFILLLPFLIAAVSRAWWIDYKYEPESDATRYGDEFSAIDFYTCENNKYFSAEQCQEILKNNGQFSVLRDLNGDGINELWSVGVAKYKGGKYSYANVAVVSNPKTKQIEQVLSVKLKEPSFAIFLGKENELSLFFCMECESYVDILWKNNKWVLAWPEPYE